MSTLADRTASRGRETPGLDPDAALSRTMSLVAALTGQATGRAGAASTVAAAAADPLRVLQTDELLAEGRQPREMLLDPVLPAGSVMLVHGPGGAGLTHVLVGMATTLAAGDSYLGWRARRAVRTALLAGRMPTTILSQRVAAALAGREALAGDRLTAVSADEQAQGSPDLGRMPDIGALWKALGAAEVLVIDDLAALLPSFHSAAGMQAARLTRMLFAFRARGVTVVAGVHTGRRGNVGRVDRAAFESVDRVADIVLAVHPARQQFMDAALYGELEFERAAHMPRRLCARRPYMLLAGNSDPSPAGEVEIVDPRKAATLELMAKGVHPSVAAAHAGVSRASAYRWRRHARARERDFRETVRFGADGAISGLKNILQPVDSMQKMSELEDAERVSRAAETG